MRNLRIPDRLAVDENIKTTVHALENYVRLFAADLAIEIARIVIRGIAIGHARRVVRERKSVVRVLKIIVTVILNATRHGNIVCPVVIIKIVGHVEHALVRRYLPRPAKRCKSTAVLAIVRLFVGAAKRNIITARGRRSHAFSVFIIRL